MITDHDKQIYQQLLTSVNSLKNIDNRLYACLLDTPVDTVIVIADTAVIYMLEFLDGRKAERKIKALCKKREAMLVDGFVQPIEQIALELEQYFKTQINSFQTPLHFVGSPFQQSVWSALQTIPFGHTVSYTDLAIQIGKPTACRAVAQANGANPFCIIVPCHRVISADGTMGGYGGGIARKQWLLTHERN